MMKTLHLVPMVLVVALAGRDAPAAGGVALARNRSAHARVSGRDYGRNWATSFRSRSSSPAGGAGR